MYHWLRLHCLSLVPFNRLLLCKCKVALSLPWWRSGTLLCSLVDWILFSWLPRPWEDGWELFLIFATIIKRILSNFHWHFVIVQDVILCNLGNVRHLVALVRTSHTRMIVIHVLPHVWRPFLLLPRDTLLDLIDFLFKVCSCYVRSCIGTIRWVID